MNSYSELQQIIAKGLTITIILFNSLISVAHAATLTGTLEITATGNLVTPSYGFDSDTSGSIAYGGPCAPYAVLTGAIVGSNITTFSALPEGTYSSCGIQVNMSNILTLATFVIDTTPPVVTVSGEAIMNVIQNDPYIDSGATWTDSVDGTGMILVATSGSVNTSQTGTYILGYTHSDTAGNQGNTVTRTVNVIGTPTILLKRATVGAPSISSIGSFHSQEIGRFSLQTPQVDSRLQKIVFTTSSGSTHLSNIILGGGSIHLYNVNSNTPITATASLSGETLVFENMNEVIPAYYTYNYKVIVDFGDVSAHFGETLKLEVNSGSLQVVVNSTSHPMIIDHSTPLDMRNYVFGVIPPTITLSTLNSTTTKLRITNTDSNTGLTLSGLTMQFITDTNHIFSGTLCLRDYGNPSSCGSSGTTISSFPLTQTGITTTLSFNGLSTYPDTIAANGGYIEYEIYIDPVTMINYSVVRIKKLAYSVGNINYNEDYTGVSGASIMYGSPPPDTTPPVVTVSGELTVSGEFGSTFIDNGATWTDNQDGGGVIGSYNLGFLNTYSLGSYIISYFHTDSAGNTGFASRTVNIIDTTPPVVTVSGEITVSGELGLPFIDSGATWTDAVDGSGIIHNSTSGSVNTSQVGTYTLKYTHVDAAGNTGSATRTVNIIRRITLVAPIVGTNSAVVLSGAVQSGTLIFTNGNSINTMSSGGFLSIPGSVNFIPSGSIWNGILYAPTISTGSILAIGDAGVVTNLPQDNATTDYSYTVLPTIMAGGTGGTSIIATGGLFTLSMKVNSASVNSGDILPVFRSSDAVTWSLNTPISSCILDSALMCTFTTDHLSYFGFVRVTSTPIVATSTSSNTTGGGGSYINNLPIVSNLNSVDSHISDILVPSITRLLQGSLSPVTAISPSETIATHTIISPITDYICPVVEQFYDMNNERVANISEGEFTPDVQALLMYRSIGSTEQGINYSSRYFMNNGFGISSNNELYDGNRSITRAEFVKMLVRALSCHYIPTTASSIFSDVGPDAWYTEYITFATEQGWITGYKDGTFRPHNTLTRAEASKILAAATKIDTSSMDNTTDALFSDVPVDNPFAPSIYALKASGIVGGKTETLYDMNNSISRNEVARIFHKVFLNIDSK